MLQDIEYIESFMCVCMYVFGTFLNKYDTIILANYNHLRVLYCPDDPPQDRQFITSSTGKKKTALHSPTDALIY